LKHYTLPVDVAFYHGDGNLHKIKHNSMANDATVLEQCLLIPQHILMTHLKNYMKLDPNNHFPAAAAKKQGDTPPAVKKQKTARAKHDNLMWKIL
jgi:hypothetical protein